MSVSTALTSVCTVFVALRLSSRKHKGVALAADDYSILVSLVSDSPLRYFVAMHLLTAQVFGYGSISRKVHLGTYCCIKTRYSFPGVRANTYCDQVSLNMKINTGMY
jgi:hypothetical protein